MLPSGRGSIVETPPPDPPTLVSAPAVMLAVVFRWDFRDALHRALQQVPREFSIVAPFEAESVVAAALPRREREQATLFHLPPRRSDTAGAAGRRAAAARANKRARQPAADSARRTARRLSLLTDGHRVCRRPAGVVLLFRLGNRTHWDLSIDTLESYRRRGLGTAACVCLIRHFAARQDGGLGSTRIEWGVGRARPQTRLHAGRSTDRGVSRRAHA